MNQVSSSPADRSEDISFLERFRDSMERWVWRGHVIPEQGYTEKLRKEDDEWLAVPENGELRRWAIQNRARAERLLAEVGLDPRIEQKPSPGGFGQAVQQKALDLPMANYSVYAIGVDKILDPLDMAIGALKLHSASPDDRVGEVLVSDQKSGEVLATVRSVRSDIEEEAPKETDLDVALKVAMVNALRALMNVLE